MLCTRVAPLGIGLALNRGRSSAILVVSDYGPAPCDREGVRPSGTAPASKLFRCLLENAGMEP
jgi:hypothetical protein